MRALFTAIAYQTLTDASRADRGTTSGRRRGSAPASARVRRIGAILIGGLVTLMVLAGPAHASQSVSESAPSYPNSTLGIKVIGKPRAGGILRVAVSGSNAPFEVGYPGSGDYIAYQLDAFAQNGRVLPQCPRSFMAELQNEVNLGISRIAQGLPEGYYGPFSHLLTFRTSPRIHRVVACAYSRLIDDDAAVSAIRIKLRPPRCGCWRR